MQPRTCWSVYFMCSIIPYIHKRVVVRGVMHEGCAGLHGLWWSVGFLALYKPEAKLVGGMHVFVALMHDCHLCSLLKATVGKHHLLALPWYHSVRGRYLISSFLSLMLSSTCFKSSLAGWAIISNVFSAVGELHHCFPLLFTSLICLISVGL